MTPGQRLRELRKAMVMTQKQLAKHAKVSQATISDYERDITTSHRADELMRISAILGTTPDYILSGKGSPRLKDADSDEGALMDAFGKLNDSSRAALIAAARAMAEPRK